MKLTELTDEQITKLRDTLDETMDMGPTGYGWQSPEMEKLCSIFRDATKVTVETPE